ncbi:hypothetical protein N7536_009696 [Penicillium majusculum]|nr:hypothetical protein N7536_009696 [Penicillium majusculum]
MHCKVLIFSALFATGAVSTCTSPDWGSCEWNGASPFCGTSDHQIGDEADGKTLRFTSDYSSPDLCDNVPKLGEECCIDFGKDCRTGYKRLWCKSS